MSIGKIPVITCLVLGAPGVGKTGLKHLLLKKEPPEQRLSTRPAENPVRAISQLQIGVSGCDEDEWIVVEDERALRRFVEEFSNNSFYNDGVSLSADVSTTGSKDTNHQTKTKYTGKG